MSTRITIPDFDFSGFYYPQILEALINYKRINVPELTDESPFEPFIQLIRMMALVGHLNNVHLDLVANESTLPTARLVSTVRNMLRLIDYRLSPASPSQVELLHQLSRVLTTTTVVVPANAWAATSRQADQPVIDFQTLEELEVERTDQLSYALAEETGTFLDYTTKANDQTPGQDYTPWTTPAVKDAIYFGHKQAMWEKLEITIKTPASGIVGVWEYYDGDFSKAAPTSVVDMGGYLRVDLTSYLGTSNRTGTYIRVRLNETGAYEDIYSAWVGGVNVADTSGYLGQTSPSTNATDYTVGSDWQALGDIIDGTSELTTTGDVEYRLPQTLLENWAPGVVNAKTAYWLRYRIVSVSTPSSPAIDYAKIDTGKQWVLTTATQGRTQTDDPLGTSDGTADQSFVTSQDYYIWGSIEVEVDGLPWAEVEDFLTSQPLDNHFRVELGDNDRATVVFGNGSSGKIPGSGAVISGVYRWKANDDGNVGAGTVTVDKSGLTNVSQLANPRPASGWQMAEGATEESLERAKIAGPATLRILSSALSTSDIERLVIDFVDESGAKPFARAKAIEEGFGPKTVEVVVVAAGGGQATPEQIAALNLYLNGDCNAIPPVPKRIVMNQEATAVNYSQKPIDITATVYGDVESESVENQLAVVVQPLALKEDGVTYEWDFGEDIPRSRISHEIFNADPDIYNVVLTVPASDIVLASRELPVLGTVSITVLP